jgi:hypothetical protein
MIGENGRPSCGSGSIERFPRKHKPTQCDFALDGFQIKWTHLIEKELLKFNGLEHAFKKGEHLFQ